MRFSIDVWLDTSPHHGDEKNQSRPASEEIPGLTKKFNFDVPASL